MSGQAAPPLAPLREEHKAATRQRILRAVVELLAEGHPATLSVPAVAARSGVSIPTIYRYFPTKEALLDAAAMFGLDARGLGIAADLTAIDRWVDQTWSELQKNLSLVKAQHLSAVGQDMRRRRGEQRASEIRASLRDTDIDPDSPAGRRLEALVSLLISSSAFLQLHETQGVPPDQAIAYTSWAISQLLAATARGGARSSPGGDRVRMGRSGGANTWPPTGVLAWDQTGRFTSCCRTRGPRWPVYRRGRQQR